MRKIHLFTICFILFFCKDVLSIDYLQDDSLKIKIASYSAGYELISESGFEIVSNNIIVDEISNDSIYVTANPDIIIKAGANTFGPYNSINIRGRGGYIEYNNNKFEGDFYLSDIDASLINIIPIENYIYSVVANEVGSSFEKEAIKAQAVAARTYALNNSKKFLKYGYNLTSDQISQVYKGNNKVNNKIIEAVNETRGEVILFNNEIINSTYSSTSGGSTASAKDTWGDHKDYLISKFDPYSLNSPGINWDYTIKNMDLDQLLSKHTKKTNFNSIIFIKNEFDRVASVKAIYTDGEVILTGEKFRSIIGLSKLKSTKFNVNNLIKSSSKINNEIPNSCLILSNSHEIETLILKNDGINQEIKFTGMGFGHGVGMSQYGANEMAKKGFNYKDIISFYYEGVTIEKIYD